MVQINNNTVQMTRGDTLVAHLEITTSSGETYTPKEGDSIRFALKHARMNSSRTKYQDDEPVLVVNIPIDTMTLEIASGDTKELAFGEYAYDMELTTADGAVDTFIAEARLILRPEVH